MGNASRGPDDHEPTDAERDERVTTDADADEILRALLGVETDEDEGN